MRNLAALAATSGLAMLGGLWASCSPAVEEPQLQPQPTATQQANASPSAAVSAAPTSIASAVASVLTAATASASAAPPAPPVAKACPDEMAYVEQVHCPDTRSLRAGLRCKRKDSRNPNNLTICHEFEPEQTCHVPKRRQRFCIDRYEYPSKKGAHPPVMVSAYDAAQLCAEQGKRMCYESEWTASCEGPKRKPFPYGYERKRGGCNINMPWIQPNLDKVHHRKNSVRGPELLRLDQSVLSGAMETCKSDHGVYDLTGNFDEWVLTEWRRGKSKWAGLKGGAWGYVRNACRPITTSHVAHWSYYFISFRCCKEPNAAALQPPPDDGIAFWTPPAWTPPKHPGGRPLDRGWTPGMVTP